MSAPRNNDDPILEEILTMAGGEKVDPQILDIAMKLVEKMFLKIEDKDKKKAQEEEARMKAEEEERGKKTMDYSDDLVELMMSKVMKRVSLNTKESSSKTKGNKFHIINACVKPNLCL
jgi:hypothetical protein